MFGLYYKYMPQHFSSDEAGKSQESFLNIGCVKRELSHEAAEHSALRLPAVKLRKGKNQQY